MTESEAGQIPDPAARYLISIDTSYAYEVVTTFGIEHSITCRDLDGYFRHVWTINPIAPASYAKSAPQPTRSRWNSLDARNTFIEGNLRVYSSGEARPVSAAVQFVVAQILLLARTVALARRMRPVAVRAGDPLYAGLFSLLVARIGGAPLVVRVGGNNESASAFSGGALMPRLFRVRAIEREVERLVLSSADYVIGANRENLEWALSAGARRNKCTIVRYGNLISPIHFESPVGRPLPVEFLDGLGLRAEGPLLVYVGRLERIKGVYDLLDVADQLKLLVGDFALVLIGDGKERERLEAEIGKRDLRPYVHLAGQANQETVAALLAHSSVVVSPHMGRALVEAALAGAPIVAYDRDWQSEIVTDGQTGVLVPNGDATAMTAAVAKLILNPGLAARLGARARSSAMDLMDPSTQARAEREVYNKLFRQRSGPPSRRLRPRLRRATSPDGP